VNDFCLTPSGQFFQLYHGENNLHFNEMMMMMSTRPTHLHGFL